jgi:hypothetical protein
MMELEKLTLFPNNYHMWVPKFIMLASGISAPIALNLGDKDELNIDFLLDGISSKLLENLSTEVVFETKEATGRADISVDSILSSTQSGPVVDRLKGLLLDGMVRLQRERSQIFIAMLNSMSTESLNVVMADVGFTRLQAGSDVRGLWGLVMGIHIADSSTRRFEVEDEIRSLKMGSKSFYVHLADFRQKLGTAASLGSKMEDGAVVHYFLRSLLGSPLQAVAVRILEAAGTPTFPKKFEELKSVLEPAWQFSCSGLVPATEVEPVAFLANQGSKPGKCPVCDLGGHPVEKCYILRDLKKNGTIESLKAARKKPASNNQRRSYVAVAGSAGTPGGLLTLDTGSNVNVFSSRELFSTLWSCRDGIVGFDGHTFEALQKGSTQWGEAYFLPSCPLNLISLYQLSRMGYAMSISSDGRSLVALSPGGERFEFTSRPDGMLQCGFPISRVCQLDHFTKEQRKRAVMVRQLHCDLNHPSNEQLCDLLDSTCLLDTPLTAKDVRVSEKINGACVECLVGKFPTPRSLPSQSVPASAPGELLHTDIAYFLEGKTHRVPFLIVVDDFSDYVHCVRMENKSAQVLFKKVMMVVNEYKSWGHQVKVIRSDSEAVYRSIKSDVNGLGVRTEYAAPGVHEKKAEAMVKILRYRFAVLIASVTFDVPAYLYPRMLVDISSTLNMIPTARSRPHVPFTVVTGKKVSRKSDLRAPFGTCVVVAELDKSSECADRRGVVGICVGRDRDVKGAVVVYIPDTGKLLVRSSIRPTELTREVIEKMNFRARKSKPDVGCEIVTMDSRPALEDAPSLASLYSPPPAPVVESLALSQAPAGSSPLPSSPSDVFLPSPPPSSPGPSSVSDPSLLPMLPGVLSPSSGVSSGDHVALSSDVESDLSVLGLLEMADGRRVSARRPRTTWRDVRLSNNALVSFHMSLKRAEERFPGLAREAACAELLQLDERGTIVPVRYAPDGYQAIHSQLMVTPKYDMDGNLLKMKGRLVASGNEVDRSVFTSQAETAAPTLKFEGLMVLLSAASYHNAIMGTIDYPGAFLNATLEREQYMFLGKDSSSALCSVKPESVSFLRKDGTMMVKVKRALYGLPESGKRWYDCLSSFLVESGYCQSKTDNCIYYKVSGHEKIMFGLHVDDKFYVSTSQALVDEFVDCLQARFGNITHNSGDVLSFLGLRIRKDPTTAEIEIDQPLYIADLTQDIPLLNLPTSPTTREILDRENLGSSVDKKDFLSRVMKLMYLATKTRPDILFAVSTLASRSSDPRESDLRHLNRVYLYLRGTTDFKVRLKCKDMNLSASVDASFGIHRDNKSHSGMSLFVAGCPIFSRSTKQKTVATSSMHAEVLALYDSVPYIIWLRDLLGELGYRQDRPTVVEQDNKSALTVYGQGWSKSDRTRHISIKYSFITEQIGEGVIQPVYVPTEQMRADALTKPVTGNKFVDSFRSVDRCRAMLALRFCDLYDDGVFVGPEDCLSGIFAGVCCGVKPQPFPVEGSSHSFNQVSRGVAI